jgi:hypothetical protein
MASPLFVATRITTRGFPRRNTCGKFLVARFLLGSCVFRAISDKSVAPIDLLKKGHLWPGRGRQQAACGRRLTMKTPVKLVVGLAVTTLVLVAADPILGTWKMNVSKSKISPGPGPKSVTAVYSQEGDWIVINTSGIDSAGKPMSRTNRVKRDGAEYPYDGPNGKVRLASRESMITTQSR